MARKNKGAEARRPIKPKGALPAPRVSPVRVTVRWYKRRGFRILFALAGLGLVGIGLWQFFEFRSRVESKEQQQKSVSQFLPRLTLAEGSLSKVVSEMDTLPQQLKTGTLAPTDFSTKTEEWLTDLRKMDSTFRESKLPKGLEETRALLVQGILLYVDAAKSFQLAGRATEVTIRDAALDQGRNLLMHASAVYGTGRRALALEQARVGLELDEQNQFLLNQPIPLPEENAPSPEPSPEPVTSP